MLLLLDTHVWIWTVEGDVRRIGRKTRQLIARAEMHNALCVSPASVYEVVALVVAGRLQLSRRPEQWVRESLEKPGVRVAELLPATAIDAGHIPRSALPDPLDRFLVATARQLDATFLTADTVILNYAADTAMVRVRGIRP